MDTIRWDVLVAVTSTSLCATCAYILHQRNSHLSAISQENSFSSISNLINYLNENEINDIELVNVTGKVSAVSSPIRSTYLDNLEGVMSEQQVVEHKLESIRKWIRKWIDTESIISLTANQVPFKLSDGVSCLTVLSPELSAKSPLQIVYDKFEPKDVNEGGVVIRFFNYIAGSHVKGHQYLEKMLPVDTILTAIGSVKRTGSELSVGPPSNGLPYLLSRQALSEIIQDLKVDTFYPHVCMVVFGAVSVSAMSFMAWKKWCQYQKHKKREAFLRKIEAMGDTATNTNPDNTCVICLDNPRETVITPCGHVCVCLQCSFMMDETCPMCRTSIDGVIRTYNA